MCYNVSMDKVKRTTALYLRTSTDTQAKGLDAQLKALEQYCAQKNIKDFLVFQDFGISGAKASRPQLDELMKMVKENKIEQVIVYSFSRFARSLKHLILALEEFDSLKVRFTSITEAIDTSTPLGRTVFGIIASISQLERELVRERVVNGLKAARARGKRLGQPKKHNNPLPFIELKKAGKSYREIGITLGCSIGTVSRVLKSVQMKPDSETKTDVQDTNVSGSVSVSKSDQTESISGSLGKNPANQNELNCRKV